MTTDSPTPAPRTAGAFDAVVLGGSTGGLKAVTAILSALPATFPAAVVVCLHRHPGGERDALPAILRARSVLPVSTAEGQVVLQPGHVTVLPPQARVAAAPGPGFEVVRGSGSKTIDETMTHLADRYRSRLIGVVLTGRLDDGAQGAGAVKRTGGRVIVQDPTDAEAPSMPAAVLATGSVDLVVPLRRIASSLVALTMAPGAAELFRIPRPAWAR